MGTTNVIRAAPDGYTIMMTSNPLTLAPYMHLRAPFDPVEDLAAVTRVVTMPLAVVTGTQDGIKTLPELIAFIKAHPGKTNFASIGIGSQSHLQGEWLKGTFGLDMVHVPYQSGNTAAIDTASGSVAFFVPTYAATIPLIDAGKVRVLAVGSARRFAAAPNVPTVAEALGMPDARMEAWFGILVPKDTPAPVIARLNDAVVQVMASRELAARISSLNASVEVMQTADFRKQLRAESDKWHPIIDKLGLRTE
jgi:tripartite-type tricarboxylate transporter receptor subunit TctC